MLQIHTLPVGQMETNCYVLTNNETFEAAVIDPGVPDEAINAALEGYRLTDILLTHAHFDHIGGVGFLTAHAHPRIWIHHDELPWLTNPVHNLSALVNPSDPVIAPPATMVLDEHHQCTILGHDMLVRHTPGHSPGHLIYYIAGNAFVGDLIFIGSVGRTDLPGGSYPSLINSIKSEILSLPEETLLHPGHGPATTVQLERLHNPFLQ